MSERGKARGVAVPRISYNNMHRSLAVGTSGRGRRRRAPRTPSVAAASKPQEAELVRARPTPQITDELALKLAIILGVSPLNRRPTCHGYANECSCEECVARAQNHSHRSAEVRQPWHITA